MNELVRWGHPAWPRPHSIVALEDGSQLVAAADWSGGAAVRVDADWVTVQSDVFDDARLARSTVRGIVFAMQRDPRERWELVERVRSERFSDPEESDRADTLLLTNGDRMVGTVRALEGGSLTLSTDAGEVKVPLSRIEAVFLRESRQPSVGRQPSPVGREPDSILGLRDGSMLHAEALRGDDDELDVETVGGAKLSGGSTADVVLLQSLGGPIVYLSDLKAAAYRHVPYLEIEWPYRRDRSVAGGPLMVGGERYLKGIGMHSASRLTYALASKFARFDAAVAVDDSAEGRGSVTFGVYVLRDGQWQERFKSEVVRGGEAPQAVSVDVAGADGLTLVVDYADRGDELDRADWLDGRLVRR